MNIFLDTSALIKLYHNENKSKELSEFIRENRITNIYLSYIAKAEFISAIYRKIRTKEIDYQIGNEVINLFNKDFSLYRWVFVEQEIIDNSCNLIIKYGVKGLRTLDSIQISCLLSIKNQKEISFISFDELEKEIIKLEEINVINI